VLSFYKTIYPGPRLNVILGPNGSGKSTILCALTLGLGGGYIFPFFDLFHFKDRKTYQDRSVFLNL
jgi:ABC-type hemin transport system ATPase subunit